MVVFALIQPSKHFWKAVYPLNTLWLTSKIFYYRFMYGATMVLELNSFWKTVQEAICLKTKSPLLPDRWATDHAGVSTKGLLGRESSPKVLLDNRDFFFSLNNLVKNQIIQEPWVWEQKFDCNSKGYNFWLVVIIFSLKPMYWPLKYIKWHLNTAIIRCLLSLF